MKIGQYRNVATCIVLTSKFKMRKKNLPFVQNNIFSQFVSSTIQAGSGNLYAEGLVLRSSIIIIILIIH